jgi:sulfide:quinone oxidoreductase
LWLDARELRGVRVALVTPEEEPLRLFGGEASAAMSALLRERGIAVHTRAVATNFRDGRLVLLGGGEVEADRAVALPSLEGQRIDGIPQERNLFVPVDSHARVPGCPDVYAAGDITTFPVKQGGIAAQQADAAARAIAAAAGAPVAAAEFRPVLRGLLLTGGEPRYLRGDGRPGVGGSVSPEPLWWPPAKVAGRHLAPFLSSLTGVDLPEEPDGLRVETELDPEPALGIGLGL